MTDAHEDAPRALRRPLSRGITPGASLPAGRRRLAAPGASRQAGRRGLATPGALLSAGRRRLAGPGALLSAGTPGQAAVELIALLPLVALIVLATLTILASHVAEEQAGEAAEAGALAVLQGGVEPKEAAADALSEAARKRATIKVAGGRVHVRVRPRVVLPVPGLAERLAGEARADAGR